MRRKEQVWWVSATVLSLAAFSFFAGLGMRGLYQRLTQGEHASAGSLLNYPRMASAAPRVVPDADMRPATLYMEVLNKLRVYYVDPLPSNTQLSYGSVEAMLNDLKDPNTRLLSKAEVDALRDASLGEYPGLGAVLTIKRWNRDEDAGAAAVADAKKGDPNSGVKTITVVSVAPGSPADKAGLLPGDRITYFDEHWIAPVHLSYRALTQLTDSLGPQDYRPREPDEKPDIKPNDPEREKARKELEEMRARWKNSTELPIVMQKLLTSEAGEHELTIERGQPAKTIKVKVTMGRTKIEPLSSKKLAGNAGYIRIEALNGATAQQVGAILDQFQQSGIRSLVIDLRNSPGGSLDAARDVAGLLLGEAKFAVLKERDADRKLVDRALTTKAPAARFKPASVSVLVDGGTAGSSELLAAALRDNLGARLVGTTTFGDGTEQELVRFDNGAGFTLTRARMLTSKGLDFDNKGLKADLAPQGDPVDAAVKALSAPAAVTRRP
ncbi:MAG TPA: S41 family peptidase [Armatimonadota bacterium]|nr:S41 family peptidase [Armatimonadota bacterium]